MLKRFIPVLNWIGSYNKDDLSGDISAGVIVAIMLVPQGMAYAMLAGLPPVIGLYASTIPLIIYAFFGTSRHLAVGPVAMVSLLVFAGVSTLAEPGTDTYISLVLLLMFMIGVIQFLMGFLRLGFLANFLSHAVLSGFTSAAAIIIGLNQLKYLLGITINEENAFLIVLEAVQKVTEINLATLFVGLSSIVLLISLKRIASKIPSSLIVVSIMILIVYLFDLQTFGVTIVGEIPKGLPAVSFPSISLESVTVLLPIALTISFVGFMESIAMAKVIAAREKYQIEPNRELVGLGLANIFGSFYSAYPVTGSFSRSAVNYEVRARTPLASVFTAIIILLTLLFFTELFFYLPHAVLAAIIMVAIYGLIDLEEMQQLFALRKLDGWTWIVTFLATLTVGIIQGIGIGLGFSLLIFIGRSAYPHIAELGFVKKERTFLNVKRYPEAKIDPEILIFRLDESLYFANVGFFETTLSKRIAEKPRLRWVVFDFSGVNSIDAVAVRHLGEIVENCARGHIQLLYTNMKGPVLDIVEKADWWHESPTEGKHFTSIHAALKMVGK